MNPKRNARRQLGAFIHKNEVLSSAALIDRIAEAGVSRDLARQWMSRASSTGGDVWRSERLVLPGGERLFACRSSLGTPPFLEQVATLLDEARPGTARAIRRLQSARIILRADAERLLATTIRNESRARFLTYQDEVAALEELEAGLRDGRATPLDRVVHTSLAGEASSHAIALQAHGELVLQGHVTRILIDHFRRQGLISWSGHSLPESSGGHVDFNGFAFSACGYSYLKPMLRWKGGREKPKPTPVLFDVYARQCDQQDVSGFMQRLSRARGGPRGRLAILGILAAPRFDKPAWDLSKQNGFLVVNLEDMFGDVALRGMQNLRDLLSYVSGDPNRIEATGFDALAVTLQELSANPYVTALRSMALEIWGALVLRGAGWEDVRTNVTVPFKDTQREVDVAGQRDAHSEVYLLECKAEHSQKELAPEYVRKFYTETVPAFLEHHCGSHRPRLCKAEIWTTGMIGTPAAQELEKLKRKPFLEVKLLGGHELMKMVPKSLPNGKRLLANIAVR